MNQRAGKRVLAITYDYSSYGIGWAVAENDSDITYGTFEGPYWYPSDAFSTSIYEFFEHLDATWGPFKSIFWSIPRGGPSKVTPKIYYGFRALLFLYCRKKNIRHVMVHQSAVESHAVDSKTAALATVRDTRTGWQLTETRRANTKAIALMRYVIDVKGKHLKGDGE